MFIKYHFYFMTIIYIMINYIKTLGSTMVEAYICVRHIEGTPMILTNFILLGHFCRKTTSVARKLKLQKRNVLFHRRIILIHRYTYASFLRHFEALPGNSYIRTSVRSTVVFILLGSGCWWELDSWNPPQAGWVK